MSQSSAQGESAFWKAGKHWTSATAAATPAPAPVQPTSAASRRTMLKHDSETREDAQATIGAYKELGPMGPEYEDAVVDAFLARLDTRLAEQEAQQPQQPQPQPVFNYPVRMVPAKLPAPATSAWTFGQTLAFVSIVLSLAIPLTAIAASMLGVFGLIVAWAGIAAVVGTAKTKNGAKNK